MVEYQGREAGTVLRLHGEPFGSKLLQGRIYVERVPEHDRVDHEPQRPELVLLPLAVALLRSTRICPGRLPTC